MNFITSITAFGYFGITLVVFAESGVFTFFFPGDSLLFTVGFLASQHIFSLPLLLALCFPAAVLGDSAGYALGKRYGSHVWRRVTTWPLAESYLIATKKFFHEHGHKAVLLARFVPAVRTFTPLLAGISEMAYSTFIKWNVAGGAIWSFGLILAGYFLGRVIPDVDKYLLPIVVLIVVLSIVPAIWHILRERT